MNIIKKIRIRKFIKNVMIPDWERAVALSESLKESFSQEEFQLLEDTSRGLCKYVTTKDSEKVEEVMMYIQDRAGIGNPFVGHWFPIGERNPRLLLLKQILNRK